MVAINSIIQAGRLMSVLGTKRTLSIIKNRSVEGFVTLFNTIYSVITTGSHY